MMKRMLIMLAAVALILGGIFGFKAFQGVMIRKYIAAGGIPAQAVSTTVAASEEWQPKLSAVGSFRAAKGVDIAPEVAGIVETIRFESGSDAQKDALLVQLRAEDDIARLVALQASAKLAQLTYDRNAKQLEIKAISQATLDADKANLDNARALATQQLAIVNKKTIRAPFSGHLGIRQVDVGQYLTPGTPIVTLQQLDPIYADFSLPEQSVPQLAVGQKVEGKVDALPDRHFEGEITAINSKVDEATRNVQVRATFQNPDHILLPGMFANVAIDVGRTESHITLPQTAITYNPYGNTVYVVDNADPKKPAAKQVFVTTGDTRGDQVAVLTGLKEGDEVVTSGQIKLRNGMPIKVNNEIQPSSNPDPKPEDR